jgi:hypothetical protein
MPHHLDLSASFKHLVTLAIAFAVFGGLFVANANAQTTWTVTIDVKGKKDRPDYHLSSVPAPPHAPNCAPPKPKPPADAEHLYVCLGDSINWIANASSAKYTVTVFTEEAILDGPPPENAATQWFHGSSDGTTTLPAGGPIDEHAPLTTHQYSVGVFDIAANQLYVHDPKIIIGTGYPIQVDTVSKQIQVVKDQVIQLANKPNDDDSAKDELRKRILVELDFLEKGIALR